MINLKVNGESRSFDGDPNLPLLWYLRDILGLTGTKYGCGMSLCGSCTVHKNGEAVRSCVTTMQDTAGTDIVTIEGLATHGPHPVQTAFMQAAALLKQTPRPTDKDIDEAMAGNICRCGTYQRIRAAIKAAAGERA